MFRKLIFLRKKNYWFDPFKTYAFHSMATRITKMVNLEQKREQVKFRHDRVFPGQALS